MSSDLRDLERRGLLRIGLNCNISPYAVFEISDLKGNTLPITIGDRCRIGVGAILYGGLEVGGDSVVEEYALVGKPEFGYAIGRTYDGTGARTRIGRNVILRAQSILYAGCVIGDNSAIGHRTLLRSNVSVGRESLIGHGLSVERDVRIGDYVRCSPLSHITSSVVLEDRVFLGAGVVTINDKGMIWRQQDTSPTLVPPYFEHGAKIGSGSTIAAGVRVGKEALVGSGSNVTKDIPAYAIAYGNPAKVVGTLDGRR